MEREITPQEAKCMLAESFIEKGILESKEIEEEIDRIISDIPPHLRKKLSNDKYVAAYQFIEMRRAKEVRLSISEEREERAANNARAKKEKERLTKQL